MLSSRALTDEELYYYEQSYKEPVQSIARLEETAKFLVGASATTSGLFLAAFKLAGAAGALSLVSFLLWGAAILALVLVLLPRRQAVGRNEPEAWKASFLALRQRKFRWLLVGAFLFVAGVFAAVVQLI